MPALRAYVEEHFRGLRDRIVARLEQLEPSGAKFVRTAWRRPAGGGGEMSEIRGELFEKGGCNLSSVAGERYPAAPAGSAPGAPRPAEPPGQAFSPTRVPLVIPPPNPL